jgi:hypothetical protein
MMLVAGARSDAWDSFDFDLPSGCKEALWRDTLAQKVGGVTEFKTKAGRVDVTTSNEVFELDWVRKWKEGMGQALAYSGETGKRPVLALIAYSQGAANLTPESRATLAQAEKECARHGVRLLVLFPTKPELPHNRTVAPPPPAAAETKE